MLDNEKLRALAALAEAATPGPWHAEDEEDGFVAEPGFERTPTNPDRKPQARRDARFIAAASPDVVRELGARVLKAEAIVRDLAASKGYYDGQNCQCVLCGESTSPSGPRNGYPDDHLLICPWRRAAEAKLS